MPKDFTFLEEVGSHCFGPDWKTPMAEVLGMSQRNLSRWAGETELTDELWDSYSTTAKLIALLEQHARTTEGLLVRARRRSMSG